MEFTKKIAINLGKKLPSMVVRACQQMLTYAGSEEDAGVWLSSRIIIVLASSMTIALAAASLIDDISAIPISFIFTTALFSFSIYLNLYFAALERTAQLERVLPDFLMLVVSNLRAGMTPFDSFMASARPEFGSLYEEVFKTAERVGGKRSLESAMAFLASRYDSDVFKKTIDLFLRAARAGGNMSKLLAANAEELRKVQDLRAELISSTRQQAILLGFIVAMLMPFLLGVGYNFLVVFLSVQGQIAQFSAGEKLPTIGFLSPNVSLNAHDMYTVSLVTLVLTNFLVSLFIGIVRYGKPLYGLKYFIYLLAFSLTVFLLTQSSLQGIAQFV